MQTHVDVAPLVKSGFNQFPELAHNEFTFDQLQSINVVQDNLNANVENMNLAQSFINEVESTTERLQDQYKDYWANPFTKSKMQVQLQEEDLTE